MKSDDDMIIIRVQEQIDRSLQHYAKDSDVQTLETRFDTELKHLATKADIQSYVYKLAGFIAVVLTIAVAVLKLWD